MKNILFAIVNLGVGRAAFFFLFLQNVKQSKY